LNGDLKSKTKRLCEKSAPSAGAFPTISEENSYENSESLERPGFPVLKGHCDRLLLEILLDQFLPLTHWVFFKELSRFFEQFV
jgi:hypothetical protein